MQKESRKRNEVPSSFMEIYTNQIFLASEGKRMVICYKIGEQLSCHAEREMFKKEPENFL